MSPNEVPSFSLVGNAGNGSLISSRVGKFSSGSGIFSGRSNSSSGWTAFGSKGGISTAGQLAALWFGDSVMPSESISMGELLYRSGLDEAEMTMLGSINDDCS